jgi:engulfment/cell motility protein 1
MVELVVTHPLVNILRGAMSILVAVVSHQHANPGKSSQPNAFGFRALKPALAIHPQFLEMLVARLSSADHALCANALQLINSLMRDAITNDSETDWPKFIKRLQELGVIKAVYVLMQSTALQDLAHPLLEFQGLTKVLLKKWRDVAVDLEKPEHRRALKGLHLASNPEKPADWSDRVDENGRRKHNPMKWRRLGFETESPAWEFEEVGFLGMMDLTDYVGKHEDGFPKILLEQATRPVEERCPIARSSLAVTSILYEHFEVDKSDMEDAKSYLAFESRSNFDKLFKPLLLQWSRLHTAALQAFFRLWKATGAESEDFMKIVELVRILVESVVGGATRTKDVQEVEEELADFQYQRLRELQMELLELTYEDAWGHHLRQVRDELNHEALQFVKEQRIRCLLQGAWFPNEMAYKAEAGPVTKQDLKRTVPTSYRYVRLSHNRRHLHYADFDAQEDHEPGLDKLPTKSKLISAHMSRLLTTVFSRSFHSIVRRLGRLTCLEIHRVIHIHSEELTTPTSHYEDHHPRISPHFWQRQPARYSLSLTLPQVK